MNDQRQALSCRPQQLLLYYYAELGAEDHRQVEQHLQSCSVCRAELSELQKLLDAVPAITPELSSVELGRFSARVMEQVQPQRRFQPRRRWFARPALGLALAGGVALLITLNLNILFPEAAPVQAKNPLMTADQDVLLNLDLLQDLELLENLELIQELEQLG